MSYKQVLLDRMNDQDPSKALAMQRQGTLEPFLSGLEKDGQAQEDKLTKEIAQNDKEPGVSEEQKLARARNVARELVQEGLRDYL